jgi:hypothetical protein
VRNVKNVKEIKEEMGVGGAGEHDGLLNCSATKECGLTPRRGTRMSLAP